MEDKQEEVKWYYGGETEAKESPKMASIAEVQVTDDMSPGQKEFAVNYNEMRSVLLKNNLMKKK